MNSIRFQVSKTVVLDSGTQCAEGILNKVTKAIGETFAELKSMLQGLFCMQF